MGTDREVTVSPWNIANLLTFLRIGLVPVFALLFLAGTVPMRWAAAAVFLLAALTDKLDGHLARSRGLTTDLGKLLDPVADKALVLTALVLLSVVHLVPWWVTIVIAVRELGITLLRMVLVRRAVMAASKGGKLKTVLQVSFIVGLLVPWHSILPASSAAVLVALSEVLMYLAVAVTVLTAAQYVMDGWKIARR